MDILPIPSSPPIEVVPLQIAGDALTATQVLLISDELQDAQTLVEAANANTITIVYNYASTKADVTQALADRFSKIDRIALAFHSSGPAQKMFLDQQYLFNDDEASSETVVWLINLLRQFNVAHIDFLACDTLNYANWVTYFNVLTSETGVQVGASNDRTGNLKYGGDWIMENTRENVEFIYFTPAVEIYQHVFASPVTVGNIVYSYTVGNANAQVSGFVGGITTANILSTVTDGNTYNVTSINANAFRNCQTLTSVTIPNSVTSIGADAFSNCNFLASVNIPDSVLTIGTYAFYLCLKLGTQYNPGAAVITIPASVTSIDTKAFWIVPNIVMKFESLTSLPTFGRELLSNGGTAYYYSGLSGTPEATLLGMGFTTAIPFTPPIPGSNTCFPAGTRILTDQVGEVAIEKLDKRIHTIRGGHRIEHVTRILGESKHLVQIMAGALGKNMPKRDTRMSMNHRVLHQGKMSKARDLVNDTTVNLISYSGEILYNVLLKDSVKGGKMVSNGMIVETLDPNNGIARLYRDFKFDDLTVEDKSTVLNRIAVMRA